MLPQLIAAAVFAGTLLTVALVVGVNEWQLAARRAVLAKRIGRPKRPQRAALAQVERIDQEQPWLGAAGGFITREVVHSGHPIQPIQPVLVSAAILGAGLVAAPLFGGWVTALIVVVCATLPWVGLRIAAANRRLKMTDELPRALDTMCSVLRAGGTLESAMDVAAHETPAPLGAELRFATERVALGNPMDDALRALAARNDDFIPLSQLTGLITLQQRTGGNLIRMLETQRESQLAQLTLRDRMNAASSEARITAVMLVVLPAMSLASIWVVVPGYLDPLLVPGIGRTLFIGTSIWSLLGVAMMLRIARWGEP